MKERMKKLVMLMLVGSMVLSEPVYASQNPGSGTQNVKTESASIKSNAEPSSEELQTGYLNSLFGIKQNTGMKRRLAANSTSKSTLNETEKKLYNALVTEIKKIAAGEETNTAITIDTSSGYDGLATNNFIEKVNVSKINSALLSDLPYDMYWYDKTEGFFYKYQYKSSTGNITNITITFAVNSKYATGQADKNGMYYTIKDSTAEQMQAAKKASENAKAIVSANADKTDYAKLVAYRNKICDLNTYNHNAANSNNTNTADGIDPWQLVYVFDGDPNTNVVCEGYSKAFAYLCDMTAFNNSNIACYTVSGYMDGGTGAGGHMWNIVTMDDGENYLVDVTNCDDGSVGATDKLFLATLPGSATGNYTYTVSNIQTVTYQYDNDIKDLYGTGTDSILTLKKTDSYSKYEPKENKNPQEDKDISGATVELSKESLVYNGSLQKPEVTSVELNGETVDASAYDVTVTSTDNGTVSAGVNAGTVELTIPAKNGSGYKGSVKKTYTIGQADVSVVDVKCTNDKLTVSSNPSEVRLTGTVKCGDKNVDGKFSITNATLKEGENQYNWKFEPTDSRNYKGTTGTVTLKVEADRPADKDISGATVKLSKDSFVYNGEMQKPEVTSVELNGETVDASAYDVTVTSTDNGTVSAGVNAGTVELTIQAKNGSGYKGSAKKTYTIIQSEPSVTGVTYTNDKLTVSTKPSDVVFTGTVKDGEKEVKGSFALTDTTLTAGEKQYNWKFTPEDARNYKGKTGKVPLKVEEDTPAVAVITGIRVDGNLNKTEYAHGDDIDLSGIKVVAVYSDKSEKEVTLDKITYNKTLSKGQTSVALTYKADDGKTYIAPVRGFIVAAKKLTYSMVTTGTGTYTYSGKGITPDVTVSDGKNTLVKNNDYTVSYENNVNAGSTSKVTVTGKGNYEGTITHTFTIGKAEAGITLSGLARTEGSVKGATVSITPASADAKVTVEYLVTKDGKETWTTIVPQTPGSYKVRAFLETAKAGNNLIGYKDFAEADAKGKAKTGTFTVNKKSTSGSSKPTIDTKPGTITTTNGDGSVTTTTEDKKTDGTVVKTETTKYTDGSVQDIITETKTNGTVIATTMKTDKNGKVTSVTEKTMIQTAGNGKNAVITVYKDGNGKTTSVKASVDITGNNGKVTIDDNTVKTLKTIAGTNVKVTVNVKDTNGNTAYSVTVNSSDLKVGNKVKVYKYSKDTGYVIVSTKTYKVSKAGNVSVSLKADADYRMVDTTDAAKIEKKILATVKPAKKSMTIKKGSTAAVSLAKSFAKDNAKKITYSSSNKKAVKVSKTGVVKAVKKGTTTVKIKVVLKNGKTKTVKVKVTSK